MYTPLPSPPRTPSGTPPHSRRSSLQQPLLAGYGTMRSTRPSPIRGNFKECDICFEPMLPGTQEALGCAHVFHRACIAQIRNPQCPICRMPFLDASVAPIPQAMHPINAVPLAPRPQQMNFRDEFTCCGIHSSVCDEQPNCQGICIAGGVLPSFGGTIACMKLPTATAAWVVGGLCAAGVCCYCSLIGCYRCRRQYREWRRG